MQDHQLDDGLLREYKCVFVTEINLRAINTEMVYFLRSLLHPIRAFLVFAPLESNFQSNAGICIYEYRVLVLLFGLIRME